MTTGELQWPGRVLTALELEHHRGAVDRIIVEPKTVVTPSAWEWLKSRGAELVRRSTSMKTVAWTLAQERKFTAVTAALAGMRSDGSIPTEWPVRGEQTLIEWTRWLAEELSTGKTTAALIFCSDAGLACCIANKLPGIRGAAIQSAAEIEPLNRLLAPNWLAVPMPGRTMFEVRQIVNAMSRLNQTPADDVAEWFRELDKGRR